MRFVVLGYDAPDDGAATSTTLSEDAARFEGAARFEDAAWSKHVAWSEGAARRLADASQRPDRVRAGAPTSSPQWAALAPSSAATLVRDGVLTPGSWPGTDPRLSSVCVLDARDLDAVVDLVRGLPGVVEIRPAEPR